MRVLVLAEAVDSDRTSEGICTLKYIRTLVRAGYEVRCRYGGVTAESLPFSIGCQMERISYSPLSFWNTIAFMLQKGARLGAAIKSMMQQWIGFSPKFLHEVRMWELTARAEIEGFDPHVIVTRGRGASFRTHAAMLRISKRPVWIANYHDPWPLAHYPEPYALVEPGTDRLLHHLHRVLSEVPPMCWTKIGVS